MLSEERNSAEKQAENSRKTSLASTIQSQKHSEAEKAQAHDHSSENQAEKVAAEESCPDGVDASKRRPMSPSTLALMCDEQDSMFSAAPSPSRLEVQNNVSSSQLQLEQRTSETYEEQERIILTKFRDCLNRLITLGEIKGKFSSFRVSIALVFKYTHTLEM